MYTLGLPLPTSSMLQNLGYSVSVWIQQKNMDGIQKHFRDFGGKDHN